MPSQKRFAEYKNIVEQIKPGILKKESWIVTDDLFTSKKKYWFLHCAIGTIRTSHWMVRYWPWDRFESPKYKNLYHIKHWLSKSKAIGQVKADISNKKVRFSGKCTSFG